MANSPALIKKLNHQQAIEVMNNLRDMGALKSSMTLKYCQHIQGLIKKMSVESLSIYMIIFNSDHTKEAFNKSNMREEWIEQ